MCSSFSGHHPWTGHTFFPFLSRPFSEPPQLHPILYPRISCPLALLPVIPCWTWTLDYFHHSPLLLLLWKELQEIKNSCWPCPLQSILHSFPKMTFWKCTCDHAIPLLQWFPMSLFITHKILCFFKALHNLVFPSYFNHLTLYSLKRSMIQLHFLTCIFSNTTVHLSSLYFCTVCLI